MLYNLFSRRKKRAAAPGPPAQAPPAADVIVDPVGEPVVAAEAQPAVVPVTDPLVAPDTTPAELTTAENVVEPVADTSAEDTAVSDQADVTENEVLSETTSLAEDSDVAGPESAEPVFVPERPEMEDASAAELTALTVPMLRLRAREVGVTGYSRLKKSELIAAITAKGAE
jgi:hypothetical protein